MPEDSHALQLKFIESIIQDFRSLASETRRKFPHIKDSADKQVIWLRSQLNSDEEFRTNLVKNNKFIIEPFAFGCTTKLPKVIILSLSFLQKLINNNFLSEDGASGVVDILVQLTDSGLEDLRVLQTTILLVTTTSLVHDAALAKAFSICFKLHNSKTTATMNTAAAALRQCAGAVFDRVMKEETNLSKQSLLPDDVIPMNVIDLIGASKDAHHLLQDICNALSDNDSPSWLPGIKTINCSLGLELIESILSTHYVLFQTNIAFASLLKTTICSLVIKLISPWMKPRPAPVINLSGGITGAASAVLGAVVNGPLGGSSTNVSFPILLRLMRLTKVIVELYIHLLNTECEVYLALLNSSLEIEKPAWQRALTLEVVHKFSTQADLLQHVCSSYDMREPSTKIFHDLVSAVSKYIQNVLSNPTAGDELVKEANQPNTVNPAPGPNQSLFYYNGSFFPIVQLKSFSLDSLDRAEIPTFPDGYCLSVAFNCLLNIVRSLVVIVNGAGLSTLHPNGKDVRTNVIESSWSSLLSVLSLLLEASADDQLTLRIFDAVHIMVGLCGNVGPNTARDSFISLLCKSSLPASYANSLSIKFPISVGSSPPPTTKSRLQEDPFERSPVLLVATPGTGYNMVNTSTSSASIKSISQNASSSTPATSNAASDPNAISSHRSILITAKHLKSAFALLSTAQSHGNVLGTSWNMVLLTLQHLVRLLNLKLEPEATLHSQAILNTTQSLPAENVRKGTSATGQPPTSTSTLSADSERQKISALMVEIFVQSDRLEASALNDLVLGLCNLSSEAMEAASVNKDPSPFPIAKLTEMGLVNMSRLHLWWDNVCCQLLSMCKLSHGELRKLASNAIVILIKQAVTIPQKPTFWQNKALTTTVLDPLSSLSEVPYDDVREKQLACVDHMLRSCGNEIGESWLRLIEIIGVVRDSYKVDLVRTASQCFKMIVADYLSSLLPHCYLTCIETASRFGHQKQDLNIALSAIECIIKLCDHLFRLEKLPMKEAAEGDEDVDLGFLQDLRISCFSHLSQLCLDRRPAIRKSACQSLFTTVGSYSKLRFDENTWSSLFSKVIFPLLSSVYELFVNAPVERDGRQTNLLIHHTRDTEAKQWAETVVLTINCVRDLFISDQIELLRLKEFSTVWFTLLEHIKLNALTNSEEVSVAALTALHTLLEIHSADSALHSELWLAAWNAWLEIGIHAVEFRGTDPAEKPFQAAERNIHKAPMFLPTSSFMTLLVDLLIPLFQRTHESCSSIVGFERLDRIMQLSVLTPLHVAHLYPTTGSYGTTSSSSTLDDGSLSPLQEAVLRSLDFMLQTTSKSDEWNHAYLPRLVHLLLHLSTYAIQIPKPNQSGHGKLDIVPSNYVTFGERCLELSIDTYMGHTEWDESCRKDILYGVIKTIHRPMNLKYGCPYQSTWLFACQCFFKVVPSVIPLLNPKNHSKRASRDVTPPKDSPDQNICIEIAQTLQDFLFYHQQPPSNLSIEEFQQHEELDCKFVNLINDLFLSSATVLPEAFLNQLINLLGMGSVQSSMSSSMADDNTFDMDLDGLNGGAESDRPKPCSHLSKGDSSKRSAKGLGMAVRQTDTSADSLGDFSPDGALDLDLDLNRLRQFAFRENFARLCFSKLLALAFTEGSPVETQKIANVSCVVLSVNVSRVAVRSILMRCRKALIQFYNSAKLTGKCPLPRARLLEIGFVFKALTIMLTSLQSVSGQRDVDPSTWQHVIQLYPHIVDCVLVANGSQITVALHRLLQLYGQLLQPTQFGSGRNNQ